MSIVGLSEEEIHKIIDTLTDEERLQLQSIYSELNKSILERIYELIYSVYPQFELLFSICLLQRILISYASFRYSHYFISYISLTLASLSGIPINQVTSCLNVEIPRSMMDVACYWNIPMHIFFHKCKYVFQKIKAYGKFLAVLFTFTFSAMLHGFNFQLTAVLVSIGVNASIESKLRSRLSNRLNSCCKSRRCLENCDHYYKTYHFRTLIVNFIFFIINVYHLIYLGAPFDDSVEEGTYSMNHTLKIWSQEFYFGSLIITFLMLIASFLI
uniref:Protein-serine O-palmitoleoyltransferase porcupine n=1 Tax=Strongyloides papillosus TaxID=174720 RepID=A0A0N5BS04_STREA